ncbi:hypothetical protein CVT24_013258 [Panaeolus cyanescens]|uniref:Uncharacterized protein n=1 Tax=Panaeolus cyanescens TaxID=181874 RepID=A0A409YN26_9AGAR|nr:hypothetical protein CVT24_013258 [Panaeolus cyanescens]
MTETSVCACGECGRSVTLATQRNHCERRTGSHGLRTAIAEEQQDLQHAFLEGLTRKRRQQEAFELQNAKMPKRRRRGRNNDVPPDQPTQTPDVLPPAQQEH